MRNSNLIQNRAFFSGLTEEMKREMKAEEDEFFQGYENAVKAAAQRLAAQFPDTPASKWQSALKAAASGSQSVVFTDGEKKAAFTAELKNL